jgi:hypothetical protein
VRKLFTLFHSYTRINTMKRSLLALSLLTVIFSNGSIYAKVKSKNTIPLNLNVQRTVGKGEGLFLRTHNTHVTVKRAPDATTDSFSVTADGAHIVDVFTGDVQKDGDTYYLETNKDLPFITPQHLTVTVPWGTPLTIEEIGTGKITAQDTVGAMHLEAFDGTVEYVQDSICQRFFRFYAEGETLTVDDCPRPQKIVEKVVGDSLTRKEIAGLRTVQLYGKHVTAKTVPSELERHFAYVSQGFRKLLP